MLGYHGESSRFNNQRQSGLKGNKTHVGTPSAPAKWAVELSMVMTKSSAAICAAKLSKFLMGQHLASHEL